MVKFQTSTQDSVVSISGFHRDYQKNVSFAEGWIKNFTPVKEKEILHPYKFRISLVSSTDHSFKYLMFSYKHSKNSYKGVMAEPLLINMDHESFLREMKRLYGIYKQMQFDDQ